MKLNIKFEFDDKIKEGFYTSHYFLATKEILNQAKITNKSWLRFKHFSKKAMVCGINEVLQLIKFALPQNVYLNTKIYYLEDGTITDENTPVLILEGDYKEFGFLENIIDGILARRSSVATNAFNLTQIVDANKIIYMADRSDDYLLNAYDGYSAYVGGMKWFVTKSSVSFLQQANVNDIKVLGTMPHALIQQYEGNLVNALNAFIQFYPNQKTVALIDFYNDCLNEIQLIKASGIKKLDYVRIDTAKNLIDKSLQHIYEYSKDPNLYGVNIYLVKKVRNELDKLGYHDTKIIISSGLNLEKIKNYEINHAPIDLYGLGQYFLKMNVNFTGDLIKLNNNYLAKVGREENIEKYLKNMKTIN